ncbi:MAG: outer membrane lipoprotein carrier protein LolA [Verrucomicrobiota bacterium]
MILFFLSTLWLCAADPLSTDKAEALRKRFEAHQQGTRFWSADFTQTLSAPGLKAPIVSEGRIFYHAPDALRIDFEKPAGDFMLALGSALFVQKSNKGVVRKSIETDTVGKPLLGLLGMLRGRPTEEAEQFNFQVSRQADVYEIELTKKQGAPAHMPKKILNSIVVDTLEVKNVTVILPNGAALNYAFRSSVRNRPLAASFFEPPEIR